MSLSPKKQPKTVLSIRDRLDEMESRFDPGTIGWLSDSDVEQLRQKVRRASEKGQVGVKVAVNDLLLLCEEVLKSRAENP